ncbi:hypothetical protein BD413DRAFT_559527 [Trametes elegans]|nr:hypothetical protein BD413DRAFT_559527 [Trametes elegans]
MSLLSKGAPPNMQRDQCAYRPVPLPGTSRTRKPQQPCPPRQGAARVLRLSPPARHVECLAH